jgi:hypothetical protein
VAKQRNEFTVDLGELELTEEDHQRIARAIQKAVLSEIAIVDRAPRFSVDLLLGDLGRTRGIMVRPEGG